MSGGKEKNEASGQGCHFNVGQIIAKRTLTLSCCPLFSHIPYLEWMVCYAYLVIIIIIIIIIIFFVDNNAAQY